MIPVLQQLHSLNLKNIRFEWQISFRCFGNCSSQSTLVDHQAYLNEWWNHYYLQNSLHYQKILVRLDLFCSSFHQLDYFVMFHFHILFQVFPNSCFLFSSCINKEYSYGCFSGGRHCRRVVASLLERFFHSQFLSNVGTLQFNFHQNQCHRCSQDHACDAHWTAFVGFGDNIR